MNKDRIGIGIRAGRGPWWYRIVTGVLLLWGALGVWACVSQLTQGAAAMGAASDYDRALFDGLPWWYRLDYAIATGTMLLGAIALMLRSRHAVPLLTVSLVAVMIQFGWMFAMTDIIAVKGPFVLYFPLLILAIGALALQLAHLARRRGWIV
ncbi:hypothetical protein ASE95_09600 [Sphingomonas sp. Leaf231]|uniref:hypothetical protein n=1 Tax=Sphingomonas sp. Leaf231 TaxID=1736301 RepID=UPI0006F91E8E|nr:hypothetical protein [Sphingomonas sp. Leaf231]KQN92874.1 hypothetical protein ASE95_09600 [Sphingomonas sp. Leaf231]